MSNLFAISLIQDLGCLAGPFEKWAWLTLRLQGLDQLSGGLFQFKQCVTPAPRLSIVYYAAHLQSFNYSVTAPSDRDKVNIFDLTHREICHFESEAYSISEKIGTSAFSGKRCFSSRCREMEFYIDSWFCTPIPRQTKMCDWEFKNDETMPLANF